MSRRGDRPRRRDGVVLILLTSIIAIIAILCAAFLARMRNAAGQADDVLRLAQNRVMLHAACTFVQEASRIGYGVMGEDLDGDGYTKGRLGDTSSPSFADQERAHRDRCAYPREAWGWIDVRVDVPSDDVLDVDDTDGDGIPDGETTSDFYIRFKNQPDIWQPDGSSIANPGGVREDRFSRRIGPRASDGRILWPFRVAQVSSLSAIGVTLGGSGYTREPRITIERGAGQSGNDARARAVIVNGVVTRVDLLDPGTGYATSPSITFEDPVSGTTATATAAIANRYIADPGPDPRWPAPGSVKRAPMYRLGAPPWAVDPTVVRNPIPIDDSLPTFGLPMLNHVDPLPLLAADVDFDPLDPQPETDLRRLNWSDGAQVPVPSSQNLGWFRVYRETGYEDDRPDLAGPPGSTFVITVGSGGSLGFRDWNEVGLAGATGLFDHQEGVFQLLLANERRHWYRIEWSGAVGGGEEHLYALPLADNRTVQPATSWHETLPLNASRFIDVRTNTSSTPLRYTSSMYNTSAPHPRNYMGTIRYIQRLQTPPEHW